MHEEVLCNIMCWIISLSSYSKLCTYAFFFCVLQLQMLINLFTVFLFIIHFFFFFFFFSSRRRHTRSLCDWSSDVCSSDLSIQFSGRARMAKRTERSMPLRSSTRRARRMLLAQRVAVSRPWPMAVQIGRASCRERV